MAACSIASTHFCSPRRCTTCLSDTVSRRVQRTGPALRTESRPGLAFVGSAAKMIKRLAILGSTGSIGQSTLDVVRAHPDKLKVVRLAAGSNGTRLREQAAAFGASVTALASAKIGRASCRERV